jgi:myo-inositol-1(or 4)-monophosphatase
MRDSADLLALSRTIAARAGRLLLDGPATSRSFVYADDNPKEVKALADRLLEEEILAGLAGTGPAILSEESGFLPGSEDSDRLFLVDPLDGTFNFVRGLGPSAVSIALWEGDRPVFGVVFDLTSRELTWGGRGIGACCDGRPLSVSTTAAKTHAALCTGFPARLTLDAGASESFFRTARAYGKVRMLGSAAMSLVHVARGTADAYCERSIMHWDVAAGLAIVEGAGGQIRVEKATLPHALNVYATNGLLQPSD